MHDEKQETKQKGRQKERDKKAERKDKEKKKKTQIRRFKILQYIVNGMMLALF